MLHYYIGDTNVTHEASSDHTDWSDLDDAVWQRYLNRIEIRYPALIPHLRLHRRRKYRATVTRTVEDTSAPVITLIGDTNDPRGW